MLFVTDGDSGVEVLKRAGCLGDFLPWRDVLHEGPVQAGTLAACSRARASFIASRGWAPLDKAQADFSERDRSLFNAQEVCLVFSAELYDQLQLWQVLDALHKADTQPRIFAVHVSSPLGWTKHEDLAALTAKMTPIHSETLALASDIWCAFTAENPNSLTSFLKRKDPGLPFLEAAIDRLCREFPACQDGLSQTERSALMAAGAGASTPGELFRAVQKAESVPFMGDWSFWVVIDDLIREPGALLRFVEKSGEQRPPLGTKSFVNRQIRLTKAGQDVLSGKTNRLDQQPLGDRWLGGTRLIREACWCWNDQANHFEKRKSA